MRAGFAHAVITPPLGTAMAGWSARDCEHGCESVRDDLFVRAAYVEHEGEAALLAGFDLLFVGRELSDRIKGAIGRRLDLLPRQILLNASHNHAGPADGSYGFGQFDPQDILYQEQLVAATVAAAVEAYERRQPATLEAGVTTSRLPVCRRCKGPDGQFRNLPNREGPVYDRLPLALFRDTDGRPLGLLFSVSTHPTIVYGWAISADYPGAAVRRLTEALGCEAIFLQGCGGDSKPLTQIGPDGTWTQGEDEAEQGGEQLANEVVAGLTTLAPVAPAMRSATVELHWPLQPALDRAGYVAQLTSDDPAVYGHDLRQRSIRRQLERLDRGETLASAIPLTVQWLQLGEGLRLIGVEGELCSPFGHQIEAFCGGGVTFPLGYTNGTGLYLVDSAQLAEGGYESGSFWEYLWPAPPTAGLEGPLADALERLRGA